MDNKQCSMARSFWMMVASFSMSCQAGIWVWCRHLSPQPAFESAAAIWVCNRHLSLQPVFKSAAGIWVCCPWPTCSPWPSLRYCVVHGDGPRHIFNYNTHLWNETQYIASDMGEFATSIPCLLHFATLLAFTQLNNSSFQSSNWVRLWNNNCGQ